jgi:hypothetical protein
LPDLHADCAEWIGTRADSGAVNRDDVYCLPNGIGQTDARDEPVHDFIPCGVAD